MSDSMCSFNSTDGLILAAIASTADGDIISLIGFIDFYYRIIISYDELNDALHKLQKSGLVVYEEGRLYCADRSEKILSGRSRSGVTSWIFKVQKRIANKPVEDAFEVTYKVSKTEYEEQLKEYRTCMQKGIVR